MESFPVHLVLHQLFVLVVTVLGLVRVIENLETEVTIDLDDPGLFVIYLE